MSDIKSQTNEEAEARAKKLGLEVIYSSSMYLQLDIDKPNGKVPKAIYSILEDKGMLAERTTPYCKTVSKAGNTHIYIALKNYTEFAERICLQLALGSDPVRETLSLLQVKAHEEAPIVLFETPKAYIQVIRWMEGKEC